MTPTPEEPASHGRLVATDRLTPAEQVLTSRVGSDLVLFDVNAGRYFGLDQIGTTIYELIREGLPLGEIHERLRQIYECDGHTLWVDLHDFSQQMLSLGLLRRLA